LKPHKIYHRGLYIGKYTPPGGGGAKNISQCNLGGKNMKREGKKGENLKKEEESGKKKRKGKVKESNKCKLGKN
jgi:hypothetical protein